MRAFDQSPEAMGEFAPKSKAVLVNVLFTNGRAVQVTADFLVYMKRS